MAEIHGDKRSSRSAARGRGSSAELPRRQMPALVRMTQWERYLDRIRRLVRRSAHP